MALALALLIVLASVPGSAQSPDEMKGVRLEERSWVEAEKLLQPDTVVVIPLGAALKEHGPHLKLRNDLTLAEYFTRRIVTASAVVATPPLTYHFYPAFLEYPGSTSLSADTARDMTVQVVRSLARYGPRRFYVLNTGLSTVRALEPAAVTLAGEGILLRYTDFGAHADRIAGPIRQQEIGSHADEIETSMMLYIDAGSVDMKLAVKDVSPRDGAFTRQRGAQGTYSPSGVWGDATLATRQKGEHVVEGLVRVMLQEIEAVRHATPPVAKHEPGAPQAQPAARPTPPPSVRPSGCLPGVERDIKAVETAFNYSWNNQDAIRLGGLWSEEGDLVHIDGTIERGRRLITQNRIRQFGSREYKAAKHFLAFGLIRCINPTTAVIDGKWDLRDVTDSAGKVLPRADGPVTLVLQRAGDSWLIEAYRYSTRPGGPPTPTMLKKPGYPDKQ